MNEQPTGTITDWTDSQWKNFEFWLEDILRHNTVTITFTKVDGTERVMNCTKQTMVVNEGLKRLAEAYIQKMQESDNPSTPKPSNKAATNKAGNITVWDIDAENWRSFRIRSITNILALIMKYDYREPSTLSWD